MPGCTNPLTGYRSRTVNKETGKRPIVFNPRDGYIDRPVTIPCGRCIHCRLNHSRQWALRCVHEAQMHDENSFITLTYAPEQLPSDRSVSKTEVQKFIKRLRKEVYPQKIKYFACGEYGTQMNRPHYHAIIFGYAFPDRYPHSMANGNTLYRSPLLEKVWPKGFSLVGDCTYQSAAYVARYVTKKYKKSKHDPKTEENYTKNYSVTDPETGEVFQVEPEFSLMSRGNKAGKNQGIGAQWFETFHSDTDKDFVTVNGAKMSLPRYYDTLLERENPNAMIRRKAIRQAAIDHAENEPQRLKARDILAEQRSNLLKRSLEEIEK